MNIDIEKYGSCLTFIIEDGCPEIQVHFDHKTNTLYCLAMNPDLQFEVGFTGDGTIIYEDGRDKDPKISKCLTSKIKFHYEEGQENPVAMTFSHRKDEHSFHYETSLRNITKPIENNIYMAAELLLAKEMIKHGFLNHLRCE